MPALLNLAHMYDMKYRVHIEDPASNHDCDSSAWRGLSRNMDDLIKSKQVVFNIVDSIAAL